ncbi:hypothetical protein NXW09_29090 [Bacteroides ovatus]|nr:hypothetical protein [Bacteroides ovatus]
MTKATCRLISFCCTGKYVCSGGLYFRHLHPDVEIELADLGTLMLNSTRPLRETHVLSGAQDST